MLIPIGITIILYNNIRDAFFTSFFSKKEITNVNHFGSLHNIIIYTRVLLSKTS